MKSKSSRGDQDKPDGDMILKREIPLDTSLLVFRSRDNDRSLSFDNERARNDAPRLTDGGLSNDDDLSRLRIDDPLKRDRFLSPDRL